MPREGIEEFGERRRRPLALILVVAVASTACTYRSVQVRDAEVERVAPELTAHGAAEVRTEGGSTTTLRADETCKTVSGEIRVEKWVSSNCEPSGACHFGGEGISVARVDAGASARTAAEVAGTTLAVGAVGFGLTCATGLTCDSDTARTTGAVVLGSVGALLVVGVVALATCKTCWAWK